MSKGSGSPRTGNSPQALAAQWNGSKANVGEITKAMDTLSQLSRADGQHINNIYKLVDDISPTKWQRQKNGWTANQTTDELVRLVDNYNKAVAETNEIISDGGAVAKIGTGMSAATYKSLAQRVDLADAVQTNATRQKIARDLLSQRKGSVSDMLAELKKRGVKYKYKG